MNWIRSTIPNYSAEMAPLTDCLRDICAKIGSNKKKVLSNRRLENYEEFTDEVRDCFHKPKELLKNSIMTTHYDPTQRLCVFPDSSEKHWGLFITQVPHEDLELPYEDQRHSPLVMMSGSFKVSNGI